MLGKMEHRILAGLLAASLCITYLPAGMGQVRAEESTVSDAALMEQTDAMSEMAQEPLTDVGELLNAEETGKKEQEAAEAPEGTKEPEQEAAEASEGTKEPEQEAAEAPEEAEVDEEMIDNYDAPTENELIPEKEYRIEDTLFYTFTFSPERPGVYYLEKECEDNGYCHSNIYCKEDNFDFPDGAFMRAEVGKQYNIVLYSFSDVTGTWAMRELQPRKMELGQAITHAYDDYVYYTFTTEAAGLYRMNIWGKDVRQFQTLIHEKDGNSTEYYSIANDNVELKEHTQYEIYFLSKTQGKSVSAYFDKVEDVVVRENEIQDTSIKSAKQYKFQPDKDGVYYVEADLGEIGEADKYPDLSCYDDENTVVMKQDYSRRNNSLMYGSVFRLDHKKEYTLRWNLTGEQDIKWKIYRLNPISVVPGVRYDYTYEDHVYYTFKPEETGNYEIYAFDDADFQILDIPDQNGNSSFPWYINKSTQLEEGIEYDFVFHGGQSGSPVSWRLNQEEKIAVKENEEYYETDAALKEYRFTPDKDGFYYVEAEADRTGYYATSFSCYNADETHVGVLVMKDWQGDKLSYGYLFQLEGKKTYKLDWRSIEEDIKWKIYRLNPKTVELGEKNNHIFDGPVYYTFTPKDTGLYKIHVYDKKTSFQKIILNEGSGKDLFNSNQQLEGGVPYEFIIYGGESGDSLSWQINKVEEITVEEDIDYHDTNDIPKRYTFTPDEDGVYFVEAVLGGDNWKPSFSCRVDNGNFVKIKEEQYYRNGKRCYTGVFRLEQSKKYVLSWEYINEPGVTWKFFRLEPKSVVPGERYDYSYADHVYYQFKPEETDLYEIYAYDDKRFNILGIPDREGYDSVYWSLERPEQLEGGKEYDIVFYGMQPGSSVSWQISQAEVVTVKENEDYFETDAELKQNMFTPDEDGIYFVKNDFDALETSPYFSCYCNDDETEINTKSVCHMIDEKCYYGNVLRLEGKKTYKLEWRHLGEQGIHWSIFRLNPKEVVPGEKITHTFNDPVYYAFTPKDTGCYKMRLIDSDCSFTIEGLNNFYGNDLFSSGQQFEGGVTYEFVLFDGLSENSVSWQLNKVEELIAEEDTEYHESIETPKVYRFKPNENGVYYLEADFATQENELWINCFCEDDGESVSVETRSGWNDQKRRIAGVMQLEGNKTYRLEWQDMKGSEVSWKFFRLNPKTIDSGKRYNYNYSDHVYYTFTPEETGVYKLFIKNNSGFHTMLVENMNGYRNTYDISDGFHELKKGCSYDVVFLNMYSGDSASWILKKGEKVKVEQNTEYTETGEFLHQYLFTPDETGTYMLEMVYPGSRIGISCCGEKQGEYITDWSKKYVYPKIHNKTIDSEQCYIDLNGKETYELQFSYYGNVFDVDPSEIEYTWSIRKLSGISLDLGKTYTHLTGDLICYKFKPAEDGLYQLSYDGSAEYVVYDENKDGTCRSEIAGIGYDVYSLKAGIDYTIYMSKQNHAGTEVESCTIQMTKMSAKKIEKADTNYKKETGKPGYYIFTADKAGEYVVEGLVKTDTLETFDPERYTVINGSNQRIVSLHEKETISILVADNVEHVRVKSIKESQDGLEYVQQPDGTVAIVGYNGSKKEIVIPEKIDGSDVTAIEGQAFQDSIITSIKLPSTLTSIGSSAFAGSQLIDIVIPDSVTSIGIRAFAGSQLAEIVIPDSVTSIGVGAFENCASLKRVVLGSELEIMSSSMFKNCHSLEELVMPEHGSLTEIQYAALADCKSLSKISFPDTIEKCEGFVNENTPWYQNLPDGDVYIGKVLYEYKGTAPEGTKVTVKPGTVSVRAQAYEGQTGISEVTLPSGLKEIEWSAFLGVKNMKSIVIPSSVTVIEPYAVGYEMEWVSNGYYFTHNKMDGFVIYGQKGTAAETYAKENGFDFVEKAMYLKGDVDLSGKVDISDLRLMLRSVCGKFTLAGDQIAAGDIAGQANADVPDGVITIADLRKLLRFICGKIQEL